MAKRLVPKEEYLRMQGVQEDGSSTFGLVVIMAMMTALFGLLIYGLNTNKE